MELGALRWLRRAVARTAGSGKWQAPACEEAIRRGALYVVGTPIGNAHDVSLRALHVLSSVDLIAAEDTRRTSLFLSRFGISADFVSYHEHNSRHRTPLLLAKLRGECSVALVTDAGTPCVSDPGSHLVGECHRACIPVLPIPGASAPATAVSLSGLSGVRWTFGGFLPSERERRLETYSECLSSAAPFVCFASPHLIRFVLDELAEVPGVSVFLAREMTKVYESYEWRRSREELLRPVEERGEFTLILEPSAGAEEGHRIRQLRDVLVAHDAGISEDAVWRAIRSVLRVSPASSHRLQVPRGRILETLGSPLASPAARRR